MQTVVGVRFKKAGKIYYFGPGNLTLEKDDNIIVETARGIEFGVVVIAPREVEDKDVVMPLKVVKRKATEADQKRMEENKEKEKEAFAICEKKIAAHELPMKLVEVEYTFDVNKIIFYFTADGRIDFRELVKDLASVFRTRIELRQIGVRDEAKLMGGIGCCGRPLCCASFLGDFEPVSIRMAKEQNLSLNPTKISGICGRLMCCLKYENDCYAGQCKKKAVVKPPQPGHRVVSMEGEGKVISINEQRRTATILLDDSKTIVASWEDVIEKDEESAEIILASEIHEEKEPSKEPSENRPPRKPRNERRFTKHNDGNEGERKEHKESREGKEGGRKDFRNKKHRQQRENREGKDGGNGRKERRFKSRENRDGAKNNRNGGNHANNHGGYGTPFADTDGKQEKGKE